MTIGQTLGSATHFRFFELSCICLYHAFALHTWKYEDLLLSGDILAFIPLPLAIPDLPTGGQGVSQESISL